MNGDQNSILEVRGLGINFGGVQALRNVSFRLDPGRIIGVMGPNGAGKTTLFNLITGVYKASSGSIWLGDKQLQDLPPYRICHVGIARSFQSGRPFANMTALENVLVGLHFGRGSGALGTAEARVRASEILALVGLTKQADRPVSSLNLMERKIVELARALGTCPKILLLDEILAGLSPMDLAPAIAIIERIRDELGITVVWIEHIMKVLMETCEHLLVLHHGEKIAEGTPSEVSANEIVAQAYFGKKGGGQHG